MREPDRQPSVEVIQAFVSSLVRALKLAAGTQASLSALERSRVMDPPPAIAVCIEMRGDLEGPMTWVFSADLAALVAARLSMMDDAPPELISDAVAELANIAAGNATGPLREAGHRVEIAPPVVYAGDVRPVLEHDTVVATLTSDSGTVRVFVDVLPTVAAAS